MCRSRFALSVSHSAGLGQRQWGMSYSVMVIVAKLVPVVSQQAVSPAPNPAKSAENGSQVNDTAKSPLINAMSARHSTFKRMLLTSASVTQNNTNHT